MFFRVHQQKNTNNLTILHQNIRGLTHKIDRLNHLLDEVSPSLLVLTEHGLKQDEIKNTIITGYTLVAEYSRKNHKLGGVAIYCRDTLVGDTESLDIAHLCEELVLEAAIVRIRSKETFFYVTGIYRPPGGDIRTGMTILSHIMDHSQAHNNLFTLLGDINIDSLKENTPENLLFNEELATHNLRRLPLPPTRITSETSTSIDCICTSVPDLNISAAVIQSGLSDHTAQVCRLDYYKEESKVQTIRRQLNRKNLANLKALLSIKDWGAVESAADTDTAFNIFQGALQTALDISCPKRKTKIRSSRRPKHHYDRESATLKASYLHSVKKFEQSGNIQDKETMVNTKKQYDLKLRSLKRNANEQFIQISDNKSKALWNLINSERQSKQKKDPCLKLNINNKIVQDPIEVVEHLNSYFAQIAETTLQKNNQQRGDRLYPQHNNIADRIQPFLLTPTTEKEVETVICSLKNKSSCGIDEYSSKIVKYCTEELISPLATLVNKSFAQGHFPTCLKVSKIYPKHKKGPTTETENYRPISLISTFSKIIEKLVLRRLMSHLKYHSLITDCQHGFQKDKSTTSAIITLIETVIDCIDNEQFVTAIFLDYSKAFDCLGHDLISKKLTSLGIRDISNKWFVSYLQGRSQVVELQCKISDVSSTVRSKPQPITRGVPQGSVLGPILFILFTNDFPSICQNHSAHCLMYADDTTLLINNNSAEELNATSLTLLNNALTYSRLNDLALNPAKTTQMHFTRKKDQTPTIPSLTAVVQTKFLGITLDNKLSWTEHVNNTCKKMSTGTYVVKRLKWIGTLEAAKTAYYALVHSHMQYGLAVWGSSTGNLNRVLTLQKKSIRTLGGLTPLQSCKQAFQSLGILTVTALYIYEIILYADTLNLPTNNDVHSYNTRHASRYVLPQHRTALYEKKPSYIGRKLRNQLPDNIRKLSGNKFKTALHDFLLERPVYTIEEFLTTLNILVK